MSAMPDEVVLYTNPMSRGRIVRWMLEEVGCPYRTQVLAMDSLRSERFLDINPMGKVPVITHHGVAISETPAICAYLADAFPAAGLAPALDDPLRGRYLHALFFAAGPLEAAVTARALGQEPPAEKSGFVGYGSVQRCLDELERQVAQASPWLLGERFSAADVYVGSQVLFGMYFKTMAPRPALAAYATRLRERAAWQRAAAADDALLPKD